MLAADSMGVCKMSKLLTTKEVANQLNVNEKMVYTLISEKGLPATKITGKWVFPKHLVDQWIEANTVNYPEPVSKLPPYHGLLIIAGSNDPLLDKTITLFNSQHDDHIAVFGNMGSMGGLRTLRQNFCHMASSHLLQADGEEYNFDFALSELDNIPAVVNFCRREQGILVQKGNPKGLSAVGDLVKKGVKMVNRPLGTGTRLLLDKELKTAGLDGESIDGYHEEFGKHIDVGIEVLSGRADAAPAIRAVASLLNLDFVPMRWERFDLLIPKDRFFDKGVQLFLGMLNEAPFKKMFGQSAGYDLSGSGKVVFPRE